MDDQDHRSLDLPFKIILGNKDSAKQSASGKTTCYAKVMESTRKEFGEVARSRGSGESD